MTITLAGLAGDAQGMWRRQRELLVALAGPFLFLPLFAWLLLVAEPQLAPDAGDAERMQAFTAWAGANLHWLALRVGVELFGGAAILALILSRRHRDMAGLLRATVAVFPAFTVAVVATWGMAALGFFAFVVPMFYVYGRLALTGAAIVAEPELGIAGAIARSVALTRGLGWRTAGYLGLTLLAGMVAVSLTGGVQEALVRAGAGGPVTAALLEAVAAAAVAAAGVVRLLLEAALYRRLARPRHAV